MHECISEGTTKECQVIRHIHFVIGCGCGGSSGGGGSGGGGGGGSGKSGSCDGSGGVRRINLLMVVFGFPFKFLLITAAAIDNNNFLVASCCLVCVVWTINDVYSQRREEGRIVFSIACSAGTSLHT
jgi:hypothetical protein